jgi:sirohydrochlorin cobaltochelatase
VFTRDALLLVGHGSTSTPDAARPLMAHADRIRASGRFAEVAVGMLRGTPELGPVFDGLTSPIVHVVPFFLEDGYFTRIVIPDLLLSRADEQRVLRFCRPLGLHPGLAALMETRVLRHCEMFGTDPKALTIVLVGHGSARNPGRARALRRHAERLEARGQFGWVRVAHLEEPPLVADVLAGSRGHVAAVIGYLANEGAHATHDLPDLVAAERTARGTTWPPVHDLGTIASDEALPRFLIDLVLGQ